RSTSAGCRVHALEAACGLAEMLALQPGPFLLIQGAGAAYLAWLGLGLLRQAWREPAVGAAAASGVAVRSGWAEFRTGLLTNVLNPKVALFILAFLPQFVPAGSPSKTVSFLLLGAWFVLQGTVFLLGLVAVCAQLGRLRSRPSLQRAAQAVGGLLFLALALRLLKTGDLTS
ncbi:MAG: LysE family translocator, partial [Rubrivivax sp.]